MVSLLGYQLFTGDYTDLTQKISHTLKEPGFHTITTLNPEMIVAAQKSPSVDQAIHSSKIVTADGAGLLFAARLLKSGKIRKLTGIDVVTHLLNTQSLTVYCVGATAEVIQKCQHKFPSQFHKTRFVGFHHGYLNEKLTKTLIADIRYKKPDMILVGMGVGHQDKFLNELQHQIDYGIGIGIGGAFDVLSGTKKRAPRWVSAIGLEWVWRGIKEPHRILTRWHFIPTFLGLVLKSKLKSPSLQKRHKSVE